ncbi:RNA methyltransferase, partial [Mesorhizobium sp. M3A.F.Ca.ET.175.01.1.1]|uniref:TrmH family RNA methyltransferase n=1 Tax=Mesorhizobium sp. M3A.F.Ca.ET.175.01.1.1 TaxID=2563945 RepID=UPI001137D7A1
DRIAGFHMHRGILAIGVRSSPQSAEALLETLPASALVVVLVGISNHDNIGSIFRNAAAFGADAVLLDSTCCDPLYRKAIRVSVGAALKVPFASFADTGTFTA